MDDAEAQAALDPVLTAIEQTRDDTSAFISLALAIKALSVRLSEAQAQAAIKPIIGAIKQTRDDPSRFSSASQAVQAVAAKLANALPSGLLDLTQARLAAAVAPRRTLKRHRLAKRHQIGPGAPRVCEPVGRRDGDATKRKRRRRGIRPASAIGF